MRLRGLCKLPYGRDWQWVDLVLVLVDRVMLSKTLIHLFADGWSCVPSLLVVWLWKPSPGVCWLCSRANGDDRQEAHTSGCFLALLLQELVSLWWATTDSCLLRESSNARRLIWFSLLSSHCSLLVGSLLLFPGAHKILCVPPWEWSLCFPQSCGSPVIKLCWPSNSDSLGIPNPFAGWSD